jgi:hypothetical protein
MAIWVGVHSKIIRWKKCDEAAGVDFAQITYHDDIDAEEMAWDDRGCCCFLTFVLC